MAYGPVTRMFPDGSDFKATALLPLWTPESKMTTVPGVIDFLPLNGLGWFLLLLRSCFSSSAGYQVLSLFLYFLLGAPPKAKVNINYTKVSD